MRCRLSGRRFSSQIVDVLRHQSHSLSSPEIFSRDLCAAPPVERLISPKGRFPDVRQIKNIGHIIFSILESERPHAKPLIRTARIPFILLSIWMRELSPGLNTSHMIGHIFKNYARRSISVLPAPTQIASHSCSASTSWTSNLPCCGSPPARYNQHQRDRSAHAETPNRA